MSVFVLDFFGDLPTKRPDCREPKAFHSLEEAVEVVKKMFIQDNPNAPAGTMNLDLLPDPEDDRILIWEANPDTHEIVVRWAMNGWHWPHDDMPGMFESSDKLEVNGKEYSLYDLAMNE
jgi:hypothetical protein